jgi:hypothetical protein
VLYRLSYGLLKPDHMGVREPRSTKDRRARLTIFAFSGQNFRIAL